MSAPRIAIVGAGMAGLACAQVLASAGLSPVIFDKSRGVGGRLATRRAEGGWQFDHGAPYVAAREPGFAALLDAARAAGALALWAAAGTRAHVGLPGMSGLARHMAQCFDIRAAQTATQVVGCTGQVRVMLGDEGQLFDHVILALPAPQILRLIGPDHALTAALSQVQMSPGLTLMAGFAPGLAPDMPPVQYRDDPDGLAMILSDSAKPGRSAQAGQAFVAHAGDAWTARYLEATPQEIAAQMVPLLAKVLGCDPAQAHHAVAHRWRYGRVSCALGQPYLSDPAGHVHCAGDWCLGPDAQDAFTSGSALAQALMAKL